MIAKVMSAATVGLNAIPVTVEADVSSGSLPSFTIVGLPDKAVEESKERVRAAIKNSGADFPAKRIIINLAPADQPKQGPCYDMPLAIVMLLASEQLSVSLDDAILVGELSLDGSSRHTRGILPYVLMAKEKGYRRIFLPRDNAHEAAIVKDIEVYPVETLLGLFKHLIGETLISIQPYTPFSELRSTISNELDLVDVQGQEQAKRALEIAAAGGHNLHFKGTPGAGKTLLSRTLPSIMPDLTEKEALEVTKIYSIIGNIPPGESIIKTRPFRNPHHTTSRIGLIGGGTTPIPGEISLAHRGVLFLDEFPEFPRSVLEALRQPLEDGVVTISRAAGSVMYPAKFMLIAASNPCPCGYHGDTSRQCHCLPGQIASYKKRISGPMMDRIDLQITMPPVKTDKLMQNGSGETSEMVRIRVQQARDKQTERYTGTKYVCNADLTTRMVKEVLKVSSECTQLLQKAVETFGLSARSYYRTIKVARSIADLEGVAQILPYHIAEALQYRTEGRLPWQT